MKRSPIRYLDFLMVLIASAPDSEKEIRSLMSEYSGLSDRLIEIRDRLETLTSVELRSACYISPSGEKLESAPRMTRVHTSTAILHGLKTELENGTLDRETYNARVAETIASMVKK